MTKGIVDPWRVTDAPKRVVRPEGKAKMDLSSIDFEADLRVPNRYVFRSAHGCIDVHNTEIETANDALRDLVQCLFALSRPVEASPAFMEVGIGFSLGDSSCNVPEDELGHSGMYTVAGYTPAAAIYFVNQSYDDGMARLVRLLNTLRRSSSSEGILRRWGVTPMLR